MDQKSNSAKDSVRSQRIRSDASRPMSVNLAEGIALSHTLLSFANTATAQR